MSFVAAETLWQSFSISDIDRVMGISLCLHSKLKFRENVQHCII